MPETRLLDRGLTATLGAGTVKTDLRVIGVGASYTIAIGTAAATAHVIPPGQVDTYAINGQSVQVSNTTPPTGPANMTLSW